ncbi:CRISPR system single-strand-specific deoxyribonuclease Cas10/Csm1 (subtype III-A) [Candidatus Nitrotoga sp. BS]|uniref:type III-A CRISPR-associated protein Cas10/Csm1 n=1 Tax=Candidatus Nitrotoga sp. BS TaxID=2890408 RepID=UPI001EF298D5|nr:type III-A CRISPR-associated protein Cas10/Csm1 [Candidatus Nitrotoga sp. BS]CAH1191496.1 CRISPR system single-strand-specific deoxyribonuclease Cas10/Csm1 (subtype III-A) [Candidatus Nitrotoga sp. BS]
MGSKFEINASCRIAIAAMLHGLGKFAGFADAIEKDTNGNTLESDNEELCHPQIIDRLTHTHTAYTEFAMDLLAKQLPELVGNDMTPFAPWHDKQAEDSIVNASARYHKPDTFLQWIIASADRLASGFDRETYESHIAAYDGVQGNKLNHYTARHHTLLENIRLNDRAETQAWRYPLKPLSPDSIFPVLATECEKDTDSAAKEKYLQLWNAFIAGLQGIPSSHRESLSLWLDHFDSLWLAYTHAIPSATAGNTQLDVSLFDHSKTTAALAVALWQYHLAQGSNTENARQQLCLLWDKKRANTPEAKQAWEAKKFLLIQGDFFGIQNFIFASGGETQKRAAKLLRGRSFYVSLLSELAALKVLEILALPASSQVVNAAGKFLIVAPNTAETVRKLRAVQAELDSWFIRHTYCQSGIGLAWLPAASSDLVHGQGDVSPFRELTKHLLEKLEECKLSRFGLCGVAPAPAMFDGFLDSFKHGECKIDGQSPASVKVDNIWMSELAADQINTGKWLASMKHILITQDDLNYRTLRLPIFGFWVNFTEGIGDTEKFGNEARTGQILRAWDFSLPNEFSLPLWNGYARRHINAYVPRFGEVNAWEADRYQGIENEGSFDPHPNEIKTLNHLARDDRKIRKDDSGEERLVGVEALMILKGDVDNLGSIFQKGLEQPTFAKMTALSRQVNAFFAVYLPWLCQSESKFQNIYTVFAGGDDFFLIGPWHSTQKLASQMKTEFERYVAHNPDIHFSAGLSMTKPGLPIMQLAGLADAALDAAKVHNPENIHPAPKNAVTCFGHTVSWTDYDTLMEREAGLARVADDYALTSGYLYGLLRYADMAGNIKDKPENALWYSHFAYRTRRLAEACIKISGKQTEEKRYKLQYDLGKEIVELGIEKHQAAYKIALFTYLYQQRD